MKMNYSERISYLIQKVVRTHADPDTFIFYVIAIIAGCRISSKNIDFIRNQVPDKQFIYSIPELFPGLRARSTLFSS